MTSWREKSKIENISTDVNNINKDVNLRLFKISNYKNCWSHFKIICQHGNQGLKNMSFAKKKKKKKAALFNTISQIQNFESKQNSSQDFIKAIWQLIECSIHLVLNSFMPFYNCSLKSIQGHSNCWQFVTCLICLGNCKFYSIFLYFFFSFTCTYFIFLHEEEEEEY